MRAVASSGSKGIGAVFSKQHCLVARRGAPLQIDGRNPALFREGRCHRRAEKVLPENAGTHQGSSNSHEFVARLRSVSLKSFNAVRALIRIVTLQAGHGKTSQRRAKKISEERTKSETELPEAGLAESEARLPKTQTQSSKRPASEERPQR